MSTSTDNHNYFIDHIIAQPLDLNMVKHPLHCIVISNSILYSLTWYHRFRTNTNTNTNSVLLHQGTALR